MGRKPKFHRFAHYLSLSSSKPRICDVPSVREALTKCGLTASGIINLSTNHEVYVRLCAELGLPHSYASRLRIKTCVNRNLTSLQSCYSLSSTNGDAGNSVNPNTLEINEGTKVKLNTSINESTSNHIEVPLLDENMISPANTSDDKQSLKFNLTTEVKNVTTKVSPLNETSHTKISDVCSDHDDDGVGKRNEGDNKTTINHAARLDDIDGVSVISPDSQEKHRSSSPIKNLAPADQYDRRSYSVNMGSIVIDNLIWSSIAKNRKLIRRSYGTGLAKVFNLLEPDCVLHMERKYDASPAKAKVGELYVIYARCGHETCKSYKLIVFMKPGDPNYYLQVYTDNNPKRHGPEPVTRYLNGPSRSEAYEILTRMNPTQYKDKVTNEANRHALKAGNAQDIKSDSVLWKVRQEAKALNDLDLDPFIDLVKMVQRQAQDPATQYVQFVGYPLCVMIWSIERLEVYKFARKLCPEGKLVLNMDSTGSTVRKILPLDKYVLYYTIVFKYQPPGRDTPYYLPLTEFISSAHDAKSIGWWLSNFLHFASKNGVTFGGQHLVIDYSFAEMNAIVEALLGMKMFIYLQILYRLVSGSEPDAWCASIWKRYIFIHICCSHFSKIIGDKIFKFYKKLVLTPSASSNSDELPSKLSTKSRKKWPPITTKEPPATIVSIQDFKDVFIQNYSQVKLTEKEYSHVRRVILEIFCLLINTHSYLDITMIFRNLFCLLLSKAASAAPIKKAELFFVERVSEAKNRGVDFETVMKEAQQPSQADEENPSIPLNVTMPTVQYSSNPFFKDIKAIFMEVANLCRKSILNTNASDLNPFYNPCLSLSILIYYAHTLPLWSGLLAPESMRFSNGVIETFFRLVKLLLLCGETNLRPNRFIMTVQQHVTAQCTLVSCNVPRKRLTGRRGRSLKSTTEAPEHVGKTSEGKTDETNSSMKINDVELPNDGSVQNEHLFPSRIIPSKTQTEGPGSVYDANAEDTWGKRSSHSLRKRKCTHMVPVALKHLKVIPKIQRLNSPSNASKASVPAEKTHVVITEESTSITSKPINENVKSTERVSFTPVGEEASSILGEQKHAMTPAATPKLDIDPLKIVISTETPADPIQEQTVCVSTHSTLEEDKDLSLHEARATPESNVAETVVHTEALAEGSKDQPVIIECTQFSRSEVIARNQARRAATLASLPRRVNMTSMRGPNFRPSLSVLRGNNSSFNNYIRSVLTNSLVLLDVDYYFPIPDLRPHSKYLDYLVCRNDCVYPNIVVYDVTFESYRRLLDVKKSAPPEAFWLNDVIMDVIPQIFRIMFNLTDGPIQNVPTGETFVIFNSKDGWPSDGIHELPSNTELLIMPLNEGSHWTLIVADVKRSNFYYMNPVNGKTVVSRRYLRKFLKFYKCLRPEASDENSWSFPELKFPRQDIQTDPINCGVFVLFYTQCFLQRYQTQLSPGDFIPSNINCTEYRKLLRYLLLSNSYSLYNDCLSCRRSYSHEKDNCDTFWVSCDLCSRSVHISDQCLNDKSLNASVMIEKAKRERNVHYMCYLCKKNSTSFRPTLKVSLLKEIEDSYRKYILE